jgi:hypothetical protein
MVVELERATSDAVSEERWCLGWVVSGIYRAHGEYRVTVTRYGSGLFTARILHRIRNMIHCLKQTKEEFSKKD